MELQHKTIIITGASSGIGAAAAQLFAAEGARVVLGARRLDALERVAADIARQGGQAAVLAGDVRDEAFAQGLVNLAVSRFGSLDGAFNNAGVIGELAPTPEMPLAAWNEVIAVNLTSAFLAAKAQIPVLGRGGSIVFNASFVGYSNGGLPGMGAYAASKAGMIGLVQSLAIDHAAAGVRINAILPGGTITPAGAENEPEVMRTIAALHPIKRMAAASEIAQAALFLLSDRASFVTGSPLIVDGGMSVRLL
jgi:NAD(P)-dependent dehydrogenase (short-subunit alcohol dehydrogenase family)